MRISHAVAVTQDNPRAQYNLGQSLSVLSQTLLTQGQSADAQALLQRSCLRKFSTAP